MNIMAVYFATNDREWNRNMRKEIENIIEDESEDNLVILGDFNGHVGFKGVQELDENRKMILEWM